MSKGDSVSYTRRESVKEIFPDNPAYEWPDGEEVPADDIAMRTVKWYKMIKEKFESFEHDPKSSIYRHYGHDYDDPKQRVIKMPSGSTPGGNYNHMTTQVPDALEYRINNFSNAKKNGWRVFEKITGWYDIEAADSSVLSERQEALNRFLELLKEDEELSTFDPLTGREAITEIDSSGTMAPITYMFPMGIEDTNHVHYVVFEPEIIEATIDSDSQIDEIIRYELVNYVHTKGETLMPKRSIGIVMGKHGNALRPHIQYVQTAIEEIVEEINNMYENDGASAIQELMATLELPNTEAVVNNDKLVETYKSIGVAAILKKVKSAALKKRLDRIKPPSEGRAGGVSWPVSAGGNYAIWITTDPFEMLTKSTGRKWSERNASCENWDGCYAEGPTSDVQYGNCIIWIYEKGNEEYRHEIGRFILRWGEAYEGGEAKGFDIGVEAQVYPKDPRQSPWGFNLLNALGQILKDNGYLNYETCRTPYKYMGYSDRAGSGKTRITYDSKLFLKGLGEVEVGGANALVTMASDENLSYADSGYVLNYGNYQALLALAQNPVTWIYENTIRRLFTRALDLEQGPQIVRFLIDSQVANYDWIMGVLDTMSIFDENYGNPFSEEGYLPFILRNPRCSDFAHQTIITQTEGYEIEDGRLKYNIPVEYVGYFNIFNYRFTTPPIITSAPATILEDLTNEVIKKRFMVDEGKVKDAPVNGISLLDYSASNSLALPLGFEYSFDFRQNYYKMVAMKHLIFQPKLSLKSFGKLLTEFDRLWSKRRGSENPFDTMLNHLRDCFAIVMCLPLSEPDDWGYVSNFGGINTGLGSVPEILRNIMTIEGGTEIRYPIFKRQSTGTVRRMMAIYPELVISDYGVDNQDDINSFTGLLVRNIRDSGGFKELMNNSDIDRSFLLNRLQDPKNIEQSVPNPFLNARTYGQLFIQEQDFSVFGEDYSYKFQGVKHQREGVPQEVIEFILDAPALIQEIGFGVVATWLRTSEQFNRFEELTYQAAFGSYYQGNGVFTEVLASDYEDYETYAKIIEETQNASTLGEAAFGGYGFTGGLVSNPSIPEELQLKIFTLWPDICTMYGVDYDEYEALNLVRISVNPAISPAMVDFVLSINPDLIFTLVENAKISIGDNIVKRLLSENPAAIFKNYNLNIRSYKNVYKDWVKILKKTFGGDTRRFKNLVDGLSIRRMVDTEYDGHSNLLSYVRQQMRSENYEWTRYWRGGTYKKGLNLPTDTNAAPMNLERERPMALVDEPQLIDYPQLIWTADAEKEDDEHRFSNIVLQKIDTVTLEDDLIRVTGRRYTRENRNGEEYNETYNSVNDMYGFIPVEDRENPDIKWRHGIILVIFDVSNPEELRSLPEWRLNTTERSVKESLEFYLKNDKLTNEDILNVCEDWKEGFTINSETDRFSIDLYNCFSIIDKNALWTPEIVDKYSKQLFNNGNAFRTYNNLSASAEILELSLSDNETEIYESIGRFLRDMPQLQLWLMGEQFQKTIPILYVYECLVLPHIRGEVKDRARRLRDMRLAEFLNFIRRDEEPEVNDAEEMHSYEWRGFSSEMNTILINYCERMFPSDPVMQERLMQRLISGKEYVSLEEMADVVGGE